MSWSYQSAFSRNAGLISDSEQQKLRQSRVAIAGLGGVGGLHLVTLARLGVGKFTIADPDIFEDANFNRQYGATLSTIGKSKAEVMLAIAKDINPEIEITAINAAISEDNIEQFFAGANVLVDGIDLYAIEARRMIYAKAASLRIPAVSAGPMGFSTCWLTFMPTGMSFDRYFDIKDGMTKAEMIVAFLMGLCPRMLPLRYMDKTKANPITGRAPSVSIGCQLAAGVMGAEICKILLGRGTIRPAPHFQIFDAYLGKYVHGKLWGGNRNLWQRLKRLWLIRDWRRRFPGLEDGDSQILKARKKWAQKI